MSKTSAQVWILSVACLGLGMASAHAGGDSKPIPKAFKADCAPPVIKHCREVPSEADPKQTVIIGDLCVAGSVQVGNQEVPIIPSKKAPIVSSGIVRDGRRTGKLVYNYTLSKDYTLDELKTLCYRGIAPYVPLSESMASQDRK